MAADTLTAPPPLAGGWDALAIERRNLDAHRARLAAAADEDRDGVAQQVRRSQRIVDAMEAGAH